jgi:predicted outer membrane repeat protein/autotransporter-associated beta strand protein
MALSGSGGGIYANNAHVELRGQYIRFSSNTALQDGGAIYAANLSTLTIGAKTVIFNDNESEDGDGVVYIDNSYISFTSDIEKITAIGNRANNGGFLYSSIYKVELNALSLFERNTAKAGSGGVFYLSNEAGIIFGSNSSITFTGNRALSGSGGAIYANNAHAELRGQYLGFSSNTAAQDGGAIYTVNLSTLIIGAKTVIFNDNETENGDGVVYIDNSYIHFTSDTEKIMVKRNMANNGGFLYASIYKIELNALSIFEKNTAKMGSGGAFYLSSGAGIGFGNKSSITFIDNRAEMGSGGGVYANNGVAEFRGEYLRFSSNTAAQNGGAVYTINLSTLVIGAKTVIFNDNESENGDGVAFIDNSYISFTSDIEKITVINNRANNGGFLYASIYDIELNALSLFEKNTAKTGNGGAFYLSSGSGIGFISKSSVSFIRNEALQGEGGAIYADNSEIIFNGQYLRFSSNTAHSGAAIKAENNSKIHLNNKILIVEDNESITGNGVISIDNASVTFTTATYILKVLRNRAESAGFIELVNNKLIFDIVNAEIIENEARSGNGGAMSLIRSVSGFGEGSTAVFKNNKAFVSGGALYVERSTILFEQDSVIEISKNTAQNGSGGAFYIDNGILKFDRGSIIKIDNNAAYNGNGGAFYINNGTVSFNGVKKIELNANKGNLGGSIYARNSKISIIDSEINFNNNMSFYRGGIIAIESNSNLEIEGYGTISSNKSDLGGAIYADSSSISIKGTGIGIIFSANRDAIGQNDININKAKMSLSGKIDMTGGIRAQETEIELKGEINITGRNTINNSSRLDIEDSKIKIEGFVLDYTNNRESIKVKNSKVFMGVINGGVINIKENIGAMGGAISAENNSEIEIKGAAEFINNIGIKAGAIYIEDSKAKIEAKAGDIIFENNNAEFGYNDIAVKRGSITFIAGRNSNSQINIASLQESHNNEEIASRLLIQRVSNRIDNAIVLNSVPAEIGIRQTLESNRIDNAIVLNGGLILEGGGDIVKEGRGELILGGTNRIEGSLYINQGVLSLASDLLEVGQLHIKKGAVYNTYRGEVLRAAYTRVEQDLKIESGILSFGIYFNLLGQNFATSDLIYAGKIINISQKTLQAGVYGALPENLEDINDVLVLKWDAEESEINFGRRVIANRYENGSLAGNIRYKTDYRDKEIWLVFMSTGLGYLEDVGNLTNNQKEVVKMLNRIEDFNSDFVIDIREKLADNTSGEIYRKAMSQLSGEFLANVLKSGALSNNSSKIFPQLKMGGEDIERSYIWGQAETYGIIRKEGSQINSDRQFNSNNIGGRIGINIKRDKDEVLGAYVGYGSEILEQEADKADNKEISIGGYYGVFNEKRSVKWGLDVGINEYEVKREINIAGDVYSPTSTFKTYAIGLNADIEFDEYDILKNKRDLRLNPIISAQWAYVLAGQIKESGGGYTDLIVEESRYMKLDFALGLKLKDMASRATKWDISGYMGYRILGGKDYGYNMRFKQLEEGLGNMSIKANYESNIYAGLIFGIESALSNRAHVYANGNIRFDIGELGISGYGVNAGIKINIGKRKEEEKKKKAEQVIESAKTLEAKLNAQEIDLLKEAQNRRKTALRAYRLSAALFEKNRTNLSGVAKENIRELAEELKKMEIRKITVEGHTDSSGDPRTNLRLSVSRAREVYNELIKNGIDKNKIEYLGFYSMIPIASNETEEGRKRNRRVEIFIEDISQQDLSNSKSNREALREQRKKQDYQEILDDRSFQKEAIRGQINVQEYKELSDENEQQSISREQRDERENQNLIDEKISNKPARVIIKRPEPQQNLPTQKTVETQNAKTMQNANDKYNESNAIQSPASTKSSQNINKKYSASRVDVDRAIETEVRTAINEAFVQDQDNIQETEELNKKEIKNPKSIKAKTQSKAKINSKSKSKSKSVNNKSKTSAKKKRK